jgi:hypothetical protein
MVAPSPRPHLVPEAEVIEHAVSQLKTSWRRRQFVRNILPLATSLALHATIIIAGIAMYHVVTQLRATTKES